MSGVHTSNAHTEEEGTRAHLEEKSQSNAELSYDLAIPILGRHLPKRSENLCSRTTHSALAGAAQWTECRLGTERSLV